MDKIKFYITILKTTFQEFFQEKSFLHSAALSYYTVLTFIPLIYLSLATFGQVIGNETMVNIISQFLKDVVGIKDVSSILTYLKTIDFEKNSSTLQLIGIVAIIISSTALFNSLKYSINEFYDIEKKFIKAKARILNNLLYRAISVLLLTGFGIILIITYFAQTVLLSISAELLEAYANISHLSFIFIQHSTSILTNILLFFIIFKFLHDGSVRWKIALKGSVFTCILLYIGQLVIKYYIANYFFAKNGGIAGSLLIILVWMFYTSQIIFIGAKFTAVYARFVGKAINVD